MANLGALNFNFGEGIISGNRFDRNTCPFGGAISIASGIDFTITENTFTKNTAPFNVTNNEGGQGGMDLTSFFLFYFQKIYTFNWYT